MRRRPAQGTEASAPFYRKGEPKRILQTGRRDAEARKQKEAIVVATGEVDQDITVRDLLGAGLHFGHQTKRWNPKMKRYIFDRRNGIHIIDLAKSLALLKESADFLYDLALTGKRVLFVGTKKQAQCVITETAEKSGQFYVTTRWLGGTLTNAPTIRRSVQRMRELEEKEKNDEFAGMHKKEASVLRHELGKLRKNLSGIAGMSDLPGAMIVVDINREAIALAEANRLNIPVIAIVDTNCDPDPVDYPIPGNDDAIRAIGLVCRVLGDTVERAAADYARVAAEEARKREEAEKKAEAARNKAKQAESAEDTDGEAEPEASPADEQKAASEARATEVAAAEQTDTSREAADADVKADAETTATGS